MKNLHMILSLQQQQNKLEGKIPDEDKTGNILAFLWEIMTCLFVLLIKESTNHKTCCLLLHWFNEMLILYFKDNYDPKVVSVSDTPF